MQKLSAGQPTKGQDVALLYLASNAQQCAWSMRTLAGLLAASRREDEYGVVQLTEPALGTVSSPRVLCLCSWRERTVCLWGWSARKGARLSNS